MELKIKLGKQLFMEDDALPHDYERVEEAYQRLFGEKLDLKKAVASEDWGDAHAYRMPNFHEGIQHDVVVVISYPGNSGIWRVL